MARDLDEQVEAFRTRPPGAGPYTFVAADALVLKVREGGRVVNVHALLAAGVNVHGHREILGLQVTSAEDGAGWLGFFRDLTARGLSGVQLVTSGAHHEQVNTRRLELLLTYGPSQPFYRPCRSLLASCPPIGAKYNELRHPIGDAVRRVRWRRALRRSQQREVPEVSQTQQLPPGGGTLNV